MAGKRKFRSEFLIGVLAVILIAYALIADWWKTHAAIGWTILAVVIIILVFVIIKFSSVRNKVKDTIKDSTKRLIYEDEAPEREPVPDKVRTEIYKRANYSCENPDCREKNTIHIHHIDMNHSNNNYNNIIVLCPTCHTKAHRGIFTTTQLRNWLRADYHQLKQRRYNTKSDGYGRY
jgi:5-methylcytosine-specific restriction endonuclease McrA